MAEVMEVSHFSGHLGQKKPKMMEMSRKKGHLHHYEMVIKPATLEPREPKKADNP